MTTAAGRRRGVLADSGMPGVGMRSARRRGVCGTVGGGTLARHGAVTAGLPRSNHAVSFLGDYMI